MSTPQPTTSRKTVRRRTARAARDAQSQAFWTAADEGRLLHQEVQRLRRSAPLPARRLPALPEHRHRRGCRPRAPARVYSFSTMGKGEAAYTLAFVTLDEGVTLMTNLVDCDPSTLAIGQRVQGRFQTQ